MAVGIAAMPVIDASLASSLPRVTVIVLAGWLSRLKVASNVPGTQALFTQLQVLEVALVQEVALS